MFICAHQDLKQYPFFRNLYSTSAGLIPEVLQEISEKATLMLDHQRFLSLSIDEIKSIIIFCVDFVHVFRWY